LDEMSAVWFRKCLRLHDNEPLTRACALGDGVVPIFILDPHFVEPHRIGVNQFSFFMQGLVDLDLQLRAKGSRLVVLRGKPETVWKAVLEGKHPFKIKTILWEQDTTPYAVKRDEAVTNLAKRCNVAVETFSGHTLLDITAISKQPGFKTPTTNGQIEKLMNAANVRKPLAVPKIPSLKVKGCEMFTLKELGYKAAPSHIAKGGEREGLRILRDLCSNKSYVRSFNKTKTSSTTGHTDKLSTTGLSAYLMCGAVSVRTVYHTVKTVLAGNSHTKAPESLLGQLYFRDMFYMLSATTKNYDKPKDNPYCLDIEWSNTPALVKAWAEGRTGYPYIDGLMRQLAETGWIHHLGRHAVACFLTRGDLWQSWTHGRDVFDKLLIDADGALNNGNWMALSGVAPWSPPPYRVYSPTPDDKSALNVCQDGVWLKRFVPELKDMPTAFLFKPWTAPRAVQEKAKCIIGKDYPAPIVDHATARDANLGKFKRSADKCRAARSAKKARTA